MKKRKQCLAALAKELAKKHAQDLLRAQKHPDYDEQAFDYLYVETLEQILEGGD